MRRQQGFSLIELIVVISIIGILSSIAVPSLLRARLSANEARTIGDHRTVGSAFAAYASANNGFFDTSLTCLSVPSGGCIVGYPVGAPRFLEPSIADTSLAQAGYTRSFTPGIVSAPVPATASPTSATTYCYDGVPQLLNRTGVRAFGIDGSGRLCYNPTGAPVGCTNAGLPAPGIATCQSLLQ